MNFFEQENLFVAPPMLVTGNRPPLVALETARMGNYSATATPGYLWAQPDIWNLGRGEASPGRYPFNSHDIEAKLMQQRNEAARRWSYSRSPSPDLSSGIVPVNVMLDEKPKVELWIKDDAWLNRWSDSDSDSSVSSDEEVPWYIPVPDARMEERKGMCYEPYGSHNVMDCTPDNDGSMDFWTEDDAWSDRWSDSESDSSSSSDEDEQEPDALTEECEGMMYEPYGSHNVVDCTPDNDGSMDWE